MLRSRSFTLGFLVGLLLFAAANIYTFWRKQWSNGGICYTVKESGWPFRLHRSGFSICGTDNWDRFLWKGLVADIAIAVCVSICIGFVCFLLVTRRRESIR